MANAKTSGRKPRGAGQATGSTAKPAQQTPTAPTNSTAAPPPPPPPSDEDDFNDDFADDEDYASDADELEMLNQRVNEAEAAAEAAIEARADFVARQAAVRAKAQYLAHQAALSAQSKAQGRAQKIAAAPAPETEPPAQPTKGLGNLQGDGGDYLDVLTRVFEDMNNNDWNPDQFNNASQGVSMVLGSGPAFAALGSMLANTTAQSSVLMNATQMQRQLDQVGLLCTSACVKQLLNLNNNNHDSD